MPKGPGIPVLRKCHDENENVYIKICYCFVCCFSKAFLLLCRCLLARHQTLTRVYSAYRGEPGKLTGWKGAAAAVFAWNNRTKMHKHKQTNRFPISCRQEWSAILTVSSDSIPCLMPPGVERHPHSRAAASEARPLALPARIVLGECQAAFLLPWPTVCS